MGLTERVVELMSQSTQDFCEDKPQNNGNDLDLPRKVRLPLGKPFFSTYHFQGVAGAISPSNPDLRNWYLNEAISLCCERVFLYGFSTPHLSIVNSSWLDTMNIERLIYPTRFMDELLGNDIHVLIRYLLCQGYYVNFDGIDDYFLEGKSWYGKRHFCHDGLIYGYDLDDNTYDVYAYDSEWIYRDFKVSVKSFENGRRAMNDRGIYGTIGGVKAYNHPIPFDPLCTYKNLCQYLSSSIKEYPFDGEGKVTGIVVHEYLAEYTRRLYHGLIQYDKMDWRVFRVVWEQKAFMLERIQKVEETLGFDDTLSRRYEPVVREANTIRMLYASHAQKRRDSILPTIIDKLLRIYETERDILEALVSKMRPSFSAEQLL